MGTTAKALSLLDHFSRARPAIGLSDLARAAGINKATCYRLIGELAAHGLAEQVPGGTDYRIGPAVLRLAALREVAVPMRAAALPVLQRLAQATGETAHMSHLVAGRLVTLGFAYGAPSGMQVMMEDADVLPFHATSSGQAVLAFLPAAQAEAILAGPMTPATAATLRDAAALRARVAEVRGRGWATTADTFEAEVSSLAVPVFDAEGAVLGAMAVAAPSMRMRATARGPLLTALVKAAREVMQSWGGQVPPDVDALWRGICLERAGS
jgi:DNA-binding IclR family transcriptional regulator